MRAYATICVDYINWFRATKKSMKAGKCQLQCTIYYVMSINCIVTHFTPPRSLPHYFIDEVVLSECLWVVDRLTM